MLKRSFDIFVSCVGLILLSWILLLLIFLIKQGSPGAAILAQKRIGRGGKTFLCYKLRTMFVGTPVAPTHEIPASHVTPLGAWLRLFKADEFPQLWNVVRGEMSLVGPRPCLTTQSELIDERRKRGVLDVRPGITGVAQITGIDMSDPVRLALIDAKYVAEQSFWGDLRIIMQTITGAGRGDSVSDD